MWFPRFRTSQQRCSIKKGVLKNFAKLTGKQLCQSLFFNKVAGLDDCFCKLFPMLYLLWSSYVKWVNCVIQKGVFDACSLHEKCLNMECLSPNAWKYAPEKTPYLDTFHAVVANEPSIALQKTSVNGKLRVFLLFCCY